jgi:heptaprenyl diphosphate synthase
MRKQILMAEIAVELKQLEKELHRVLENPIKGLEEMSLYLLEAGGKRIRPAFTMLTGKLFGCNSQELKTVAMAVETIHMATLAHDDIVDEALLRRGRPTLAARWGNELAVVTGDYLLVRAMRLIREVGNREVAAVLAQITVDMCRGEIFQIQTTCDTRQRLADYFYKIKRKTALLISLSCQAGAMVAGASPREVWILTRYGHCLGMAFQIKDDILDIASEEKILGKPIGGDIRQGVITLPMIYAMRGEEQGARRLRELLGRREKSPAEVGEALALIRDSGSIESCQELAERYVEKACRHLAELPSLPERETLREMAIFTGQRSY